MPENLTIRKSAAVVDLTSTQMRQLRPVMNNALFLNNGMVLAQVRNGKLYVRWVPPFKARILYIVARLLGIRKVRDA